MRRVFEVVDRGLSAFGEWFGFSLPTDLLEAARACVLLAAGVCLGARLAGDDLWVGLVGMVLLMVWLVLMATDEDDQGGGGEDPDPEGPPPHPRPQRRLPRATRRPLCPDLRARERR